MCVISIKRPPCFAGMLYIALTLSIPSTSFVIEKQDFEACNNVDVRIQDNGFFIAGKMFKNRYS